MRKLGSIFICIYILCAFNANAQDNITKQPINYYKTHSDAKIPTDNETILGGKKLFSNQCAECHEFCKQKTGPSLSSVTDRRPLSWLLAFIPSSQTVIQSGDEYAQHLYKSYSNTVMPDFKYLSEDDILSILAYIKQESSAASSVAGVNASGVSNGGKEIEKHEAYLDDHKAESAEQVKQQDSTYDTMRGSFKVGMLIVVLVTLAVALMIIGVIWKRTRREKHV